MNVLFPTPGEPVIPTRRDVSVRHEMTLRRLSAVSKSEVLELSTSVIAFDTQVRSPEITPAVMSSNSLSCITSQST